MPVETLTRDEIVALIRSELATQLVERAPDAFTSAALPPDCPSRRAFATRCRSIPEARRRGRGWIVPRAAWNADVERRRIERRRKPFASVIPLRADVDELAQRMVAAASRRTR
jgi:hypothetical protein